MATLCDPRFCLNFTDSPAEVTELAVQKLIDLYAVFDEPEVAVPSTTEKPKRRRLMKLLLDDDGCLNKSVSTKEKTETELNNYLSIPKVCLDSDLLIWWNVPESSFPGKVFGNSRNKCVLRTCF